MAGRPKKTVDPVPASPQTAPGAAQAAQQKHQQRTLARQQASRAAAAAGARGGHPIGSTGGSSVSHPFRTIVEASHSSARWTPGNAKAVMDWYQGLEEAIQAFSACVTAHGRALNEEFEIDSSAGEQAAMLGTQLAKMSDFVGNAQTAFFRAHADMIARIENPHPHGHKWDINANR